MIAVHGYEFRFEVDCFFINWTPNGVTYLDKIEFFVLDGYKCTLFEITFNINKIF